MKVYNFSDISTTFGWFSMLFILVYAPPVLPYTNLMLGCTLLFLILIGFNRRYLNTIRQSGLGLWLKIMAFILAYDFILPLPMSFLYDDIVDLPHYYHLFNRFAVLIFMEFTCITYLLTHFEKEKYSFLYLVKLLIWVAMLQSVLACAAFIFPSVKEVFLSFMTQMGGMSTENEGVVVNRTFGFASSMLDQFGFCTGLIGGVSFFLGVNYKTRYVFYSLFIMIASLLNARSGILIYIMAIAITVFFSVFMNHNIRMMVKSLIMILLIPTIFMMTIQVISIYNENTGMWLSNGVDSVIEFMDTGSSDKDNMAIITSDRFWELPDDLRLVIGTGHSRYGAEGYQHTDCGYVNDLWFVGILGVSILYGFVLLICYKIYRYSSDSFMKFLAVFYTVSFLVFDVKAAVIGYHPGGAIFFFMLFAAHFYTKKNMNRIEDLS